MSRHLAIAGLSFEDLASLLSGERTLLGVPIGAKVEGVRLEPQHITIKLSHDSFRPVADGDRVPDIRLSWLTPAENWK